MKPVSAVAIGSIVIVALAIASFACTSETAGSPRGGRTIVSTDYTQTCAQDADCFPITEGTACVASECGCPNGAINHSSRAQYDSDRNSLDCPVFDVPNDCRNVRCLPPRCESGTCRPGGRAPTDGGTD